MAAITTRIPAVLAAATVAAQVGYPLCHGETRDIVTVAVVLLFAATCLAHAVATFGYRWTLQFFVVTAGLGLLVEMIGTASGFPFGCYDYATGRLGPSVANVPLVVPLAWTAGVYPVWIVARLLYRNRGARIVTTAIGALGWDLYLDPQMVADHQWTWCSAAPGVPGLSEIPYTNYLAWFAVAVVMAACIEAGSRGHRSVPLRTAYVPVTLFLWTWLGSALAHAVFLDGPQLRQSALYGFVVMGVPGIALLVRIVGGNQGSGRHTDPCL